MRTADRLGTDGKPRSRGFGFLQFEEHEAALAVVRELNNNPKYLKDERKRPIVMFAWQDAQALRKLVKKREQVKTKLNYTKGGEAAKKNSRDNETFKKSVKGRGGDSSETDDAGKRNKKHDYSTDRKRQRQEEGGEGVAAKPTPSTGVVRGTAQNKPQRAPFVRRPFQPSLLRDQEVHEPKTKKSRRERKKEPKPAKHDKFDDMVDKYKRKLEKSNAWL